MDWIKAIIDVLWSLFSIPVNLFGFVVTPYGMFSFAVVCGLIIKLIFGGTKNGD